MAKNNSMKDFLAARKLKADQNLTARGQTEEVKAVVSSGIVRHELADALNKKAKYDTISYKDLLLADEENQKRVFKPNLEDLKSKIEKDGQQQAIFVRPAPGKPGKYQIISGFSRAQVLAELKRDIAVKIYDGATDEECLLLGIDENVVRNDMKAVDIINYIHAIEKQYPEISMDDIADIIGKRRSSLFSYLKIEKCSDVLKALTTEKITLRTAVELSSMEEKEREKSLAAEIATKKEGDNDKDKKSVKKTPFKLFLDPKRKKFKLPSITAPYSDKQKVIEILQDVISKLKELSDKA
jgi:ParB/RepB/Spo0J family partition protein